MRLGEEHGIPAEPDEALAQLGEEAVVAGQVTTARLGLLDEERRAVDAETADAQPFPEGDDLLHLRAHLRVLAVEVGLERVEAVVVPRLRHLVVGPRRLLHPREHHALVPVGGLLVGPHVPVAVPGCRVGAGRLEPRVLVTRVVEDEVEHDPDAALVALGHELGEVAERPQRLADPVVVGDVVAAVAVRRRVDGVEPEHGDAEPAEVVQPAGQAAEVADAVTVGVLEQPDVEAVDDPAAIPPCRHPLVIPSRGARTARTTGPFAPRPRTPHGAGRLGGHLGNSRRACGCRLRGPSGGRPTPSCPGRAGRHAP